MTAKRIVVLSDAQIPFQDKRAMNNVYEFLKEYQPELLASVGDDVDFPQVSRWNRNMEGEYQADLQSHVDAGVAHFEKLRAALPYTDIKVMRSNHMDRPLNYIRKYAPGLMGLTALTVPALLHFDELDVQYFEQPIEIAPGWALAHGDEGSLIKTPGGTAMGLAKKWGMSVVCGHTHRLGIQHDHMAMNLKYVAKRYGFEVGNLMDLKKADYLKSGHANWNLGFGILYQTSRGQVDPQPVFIRDDGSFIVEGIEYGGKS